MPEFTSRWAAPGASRTILHHPVQTSIVIGRTRGVIVTVLINKRYMFSLLGRCQKYAAINDRCHHQVYVIHKYMRSVIASSLRSHIQHTKRSCIAPSTQKRSMIARDSHTSIIDIFAITSVAIFCSSHTAGADIYRPLKR